MLSRAPETACLQERPQPSGGRTPALCTAGSNRVRGSIGRGRAWGWAGAPGQPSTPLPPSQDHTSPCLPTECQNHTQAPSVRLLPPPPQGLWLSDKAEFTCLAMGEALQDARFSWEVNGQPHAGAVEERPTWHMNGSWSQSSRLALPRSLWASGSNITCTLSGPGLWSPVTLTAQREHGEGSRGPRSTPATSFPRGPTPWSSNSRAYHGFSPQLPQCPAI